MVTSHAHRTSPVLRGKWILENIIGVAPAPPPDDVPALSDEEHPEQAAVGPRSAGAASCQPGVRQLSSGARPAGLRARELRCRRRVAHHGTGVRLASPIDASGQLVDGTQVDGVVALRQALVREPRDVRAHDDREAADLRRRARAGSVRHAGGAEDRARLGAEAVSLFVAGAGRREQRAVPDADGERRR